VSAEVELRMLEGSEFQTEGAAMLKPREAKVVRTVRAHHCIPIFATDQVHSTNKDFSSLFQRSRLPRSECTLTHINCLQQTRLAKIHKRNYYCTLYCAEKIAPLRPYLQNGRQQKDKDPGVRNDGWLKQKRTASPRMFR